jgi:hypothetical protein
MDKKAFEQFAVLFEKSKYYPRHDARVIWEAAKQDDQEAKQIRREVWAPSRKSAALKRKLWRRGLVSPRRGPRISRGQVLRLGNGQHKLKNLRTCLLCHLLIHGRKYQKYHSKCWKVWMRSSDFQRERERRRWSTQKSGRQPIDPPYPGFMGPPPAPINLRRKYTWFMKKLSGVPVNVIAKGSGVKQSTVSIGIEDFKRRFPGSWELAFATGSSGANQERELLFPLREFKVPGRELLIRWLAGWGMALEDISRLVGYSVGEVHQILREGDEPTGVSQRLG